MHNLHWEWGGHVTLTFLFVSSFHFSGYLHTKIFPIIVLILSSCQNADKSREELTIVMMCLSELLFITFIK